MDISRNTTSTFDENNQVFRDMCEKASACYNIDSEQYTKYHIKRGLRNSDGSGVLAGLTNISEVHGYVVYESEKMPDVGKLSIRGHDINKLTASFGINNRFGLEEISYLLLFGKLPTKDELLEYCQFLAQSRELPPFFAEDMILKSPSRDIMNKMSRSVLTLYSYDENPDDCSIENVLRQSIQLLARLPLIAAYGYSAKVHYYDKKSLILHQPKPELSIAENLLRMLSKNKQFTELDAEILDTTLMLQSEHGGGNNSTFTCRVLSSSGTDTYSAIGGAICSLKGPKHGGANLQVLRMMENIKENVQDWENDDEIYNYLTKIVRKEANDNSGLIYGIGHAIYTESDPRCLILKEKARILSKQNGFEEEFNFYDRIERIAPQAFSDVKKSSKAMCANVDFYSGFVYRMLNIPPEMFTPLFAIARTSGWCAHRMEEIVSNGKIIRPAYKTLCRDLNQYLPIEER